MRVYGRTLNSDGTKTWVVVQTDSSGNSEYVYLTWLIQVLKLILGESPFYANYGIPAVQSVVSQVFPDYYVSQVQAQFSQYFASLIISKITTTQYPAYTVSVLFNNGTSVQTVVDADNLQTNTAVTGSFASA